MAIKQITKEEFIKKIHREFPEYLFSSAELINHGVDHAVLVLDKKFIFRFPKTKKCERQFQREVALLQTLEKRTSVSVPRYTHLSKNKTFGGYPIIQGKEMTPTRFRRANPKQQRKIAKQLGDFLTGLHGLNTHKIASSFSKNPWSAENLVSYEKRYKKDRRNLIATFVDAETLSSIDTFYPLYKETCRRIPARRLIHDDLTEWHMLIDTTKNRLAGVIDFADASLNDPAIDFLFFWFYSNEMPKDVFRHYAFKQDTDLLKRSEWHHVRFLIDSLWGALMKKRLTRAKSLRTSLKKRLELLLQT